MNCLAGGVLQGPSDEDDCQVAVDYLNDLLRSAEDGWFGSADSSCEYTTPTTSTTPTSTPTTSTTPTSTPLGDGIFDRVLSQLYPSDAAIYVVGPLLARPTPPCGG